MPRNGGGKVTFELDSRVGEIGSCGVEVLSEPSTREIQPDSARSFSDTIAPLDVVVYRITPKAADEAGRAHAVAAAAHGGGRDGGGEERWTYSAGSAFPSVWFGGSPWHSDVPTLRSNNVLNYSTAYFGWQTMHAAGDAHVSQEPEGA